MTKDLGFEVKPGKGSHVKLAKGNFTVPVPLRKSLGRKMLCLILKQAGVSREEFLLAI